MDHPIVTLDVREDIRNGREPFSKIMAATAELQPNQQLLLIAPFEPVPLFHMMEKRGFSHHAEPIADGAWKVVIARQAAAQPINCPGTSQGAAASTETEIIEVDARGLEPPQPMVKILETLAGLPERAELHARTDRRPLHVYPHLEERGFRAETLEQTDGSYLTHIRRR